MEFIKEGEDYPDRKFALMAWADFLEEAGNPLSEGLRVIIAAGYRATWPPYKPITWYEGEDDSVSNYLSFLVPPKIFRLLTATPFPEEHHNNWYTEYQTETEAYLDLAQAILRGKENEINRLI